MVLQPLLLVDDRVARLDEVVARALAEVRVGVDRVHGEVLFGQVDRVVEHVDHALERGRRQAFARVRVGVGDAGTDEQGEDGEREDGGGPR